VLDISNKNPDVAQLAHLTFHPHICGTGLHAATGCLEIIVKPAYPDLIIVETLLTT